MDWLDIAGPPGVGKSTLVDPLWHPRAIEPDGRGFPAEWSDFLECTARLLDRVRGHASFNKCLSMVNRSFRKMSTVARMQSDRIYIQTGLAQRGLGIGWRLNDPEEIAEYFTLMPVSIGVALLYADVETVQRRNVERGKDRSFMVPLMERPWQIARDVLRARGVEVLELDTRHPRAFNGQKLLNFATRIARDRDPDAARFGCEMATISALH